jgi:hypothetical protein
MKIHYLNPSETVTLCHILFSQMASSLGFISRDSKSHNPVFLLNHNGATKLQQTLGYEPSIILSRLQREAVLFLWLSKTESSA